VVEKELDEEAEVLTVDLVGVPVHLEHGQTLLPGLDNSQSIVVNTPGKKSGENTELVINFTQDNKL
jgi:hypothetical protein